MQKALYSETLDVAWLLWLDTIERLDTILLEIRHSQINLIHALRTKQLYAPLRFEEEYLWGSYVDQKARVRSWHDLLGEPATVGDMERWVGAWIIPYPAFTEAIVGTARDIPPEAEPQESEDPRRHPSAYCQVSRRNEITALLKGAIAEKARDGYWAADGRRLYHTLCSLQHLKSNVLRDKLVLCRWGIIAVGSRQSRSADHMDQRRMALGRFLMTRSAVMAAAHRHIQNLGDLKAQFESALDLGIQDHPKPMTRRRREQGLYSSYLADRCRDLGEVLEDYLVRSNPLERKRRALRPESRERHHEGKPSKYRGGLYAHRWTHSATSSASVMRDEIDRREWNEKRRDTDLVNTSFWMPDRPDLQSIIAHEVAHTTIHHAYGNLEPYELRKKDGHFPELVRLLSVALDAFGMVRFPSGDPRYAHDHALTELTCDLLAATVTGPAYLFALVQEIIGQDLDCLFHSPQHDIDFDLADFWLDDGWTALNLPGFEWYYRLGLTCAWTKAIVDPNDSLARRLIAGVEELCQILLETVGRLGPKGVEAHLYRWRRLTDTMVDEIRRSEALADAKAWTRNARKIGAKTVRPLLVGEQPVAYDPLSSAVVGELHKIIVKLKKKEKRLLWRDAQLDDRGSWVAFAKHYLGEGALRRREDSCLFRYLHDIPWQAAMLRARDFLYDDGARCGRIWNTADKGDWLQEMHTDGAPGRELYQIALEFDYWHQTSPVDPISAIMRWWEAMAATGGHISTLLDKIESVDHDDADVIRQWIPPYTKSRESAIRNIQHFIDAPVDAKIKTQDIVKKIGPIDLIDAPFFKFEFPSGVSQGARRHFFIRLQKCKIEELKRVCAKYGGEYPVSELLGYLKSTTHDSDVEHEMLAAFLDKTESLPTIVMLERTAASQLDDYAQRQESGPFFRPDKPEMKLKSSYHPLLGRYDLFGISHGDLTFRPQLPMFGEATGGSEPLPPPFFVRHELAIAYRLFSDKELPLQGGGFVPLAFLSITLHSRSDRLDFLYRLRTEYRNGGVGALGNDDLALLSEGWGDIILVLQIPTECDQVSAAKEGRKKVREVFDVQQRLFSDFLVARTELILTFRALKFVCATDEDCIGRDDFWPFSIITRLRLNKSMARREHYFSPNDVIRGGMREMVAKCSQGRPFDVVRTPGRTDFTVYFRCRHVLANADFRSRFFDKVGSSDDVLTVVGYREDLDGSGICSAQHQPPKSFECKDKQCCFRQRG